MLRRRDQGRLIHKAIFQFHNYSMAERNTVFLTTAGGRKTVSGICGYLRFVARVCGNLRVGFGEEII